MATHLIASDKWMIHVLEAMKIDPAHVSRLIIDARAGEVLKVYIEYYGGSELLNVQPPDASFAEVVIANPPSPTVPENAREWWGKFIRGHAL